ncbi:hypothetical protein OG874_06055 [Nocardia sp. NBC_00565]|nr:hypothetical protein [Nocardia sp. NBC_00565]WUC04733.1 hypothetical protein OG874_06055 [Nocardia sp. NBC_00565]
MRWPVIRAALSEARNDTRSATFDPSRVADRRAAVIDRGRAQNQVG